VWVVGCVFALFNSLVWYASEARPPGRLAWSVRGSAGRLLRGFRGGAAVALAGVSPLVLAFAVIRVIRDPGGRGTPRAVELYVEAVTTSAALAVVVGLALAAHNWLDAPPSRATHVSPLNSLSQDRRSALLSALVAGLVVASTGLLGWYAGTVSGDVLLRVLTNWAGWPGRPDVGTLAADRWHTVSHVFGDANMLLGVAMLLPGVFIALLVLMGRAWPRFVVARCYLAVRGRLPWRLMAFLADARHRELLRQAGGVYQFRHIRLQETLAGEPTFEESVRAREEAARHARVRRRTVLAAGAGVLVAGTAWVIGERRDESVARLALPARERVVSLAMRPGAGRQVCFAFDDGSVRRWSGDTADHSTELVSRVPAEWTGNGAPALAFSANGRFLLTAPYGAGGPEVLDLRDGRPLRISHSDGDASAASHIAVHGDLLAWHNGSTVGVWTLSRNGVSALVTKSAFHDVSVGQGNDSAFVDLGFLSDGSLLVMGDSGGLWRFSAPSYAEGVPSPPYTRLWRANVASAYPDDTSDGIVQLAVGRDDSLALFGPGGGELWQGDGTGWSSASVDLGATAVTGAFHPTLALLAVADRYGGDVQLWHTDDPRKARKLTGHAEPVQALDFSADGNWLATGSADGTVRIWDVRNP